VLFSPAVSAEVLQVFQPMGVDAALNAMAAQDTEASDRRRQIDVATENLIRAGTDASMGYSSIEMVDLLRLIGGLLVGFGRMRHAKRRSYFSALSVPRSRLSLYFPYRLES
jgi:hypothetical protein